MFRDALLRRHKVVATDSPQVSAGDALADLFARSGKGDQAAFAELYDALAPMVYGTILKVLRDPAQAEEVSQETFVELWRLAPRFDGTKGSARAWATTLAHRRAIDRVRSEQSARHRVEREAQRNVATQPDVADHVVTSLDAGRVRKALERLTVMQREAVELAYFGGHSYRDVAVLLGVPEGTIKTRIRDGMIRLRDELGVGT